MLSSLTIFKKTVADDKSAVISQKIASELLERLDLFHYFNPAFILEVGCGTGYCLKFLQKAYPHARYFGLESSYAQLLKAKTHAAHQRLKPPPTFLLGDIEKLQFIGEQFDLICANLALLWIHDLGQCLLKLKKLLKPNGLLLFSMLGPDTFKELSIYRQFKDAAMAPGAFVDMHHLGDMLVKAQFSDVVVDAHYFDVRYNNFHHAYQEIKQMGFASLLSDRQAIPEQHPLYLEYNDISITWEILYAQAWCLPHQKVFSNTSSQEIAIPIDKIYKK